MRFLLSKYIAGLPLLLGVGLLLVSVSNWMLATDPAIAWMGLGTVVALGVSLAGLSVGMGALYPNFKVEHVAKIASGPGGILFMVLSVSFVIGVIVMESVPLWLLLRAARRHRALLPWEFALTGGLILATVIALIIGGVLPMRAGARRLESGQ